MGTSTVGGAGSTVGGLLGAGTILEAEEAEGALTLLPTTDDDERARAVSDDVSVSQSPPHRITSIAPASRHAASLSHAAAHGCGGI